MCEQDCKKRIELSYLAALMDGEGSWSIQVDSREYKGRPSIRFNPAMTMTLKYHNETLNRLVNEFGGKIYDYSKDDMKRWHLGQKKQLIMATEKLLPFLDIKYDIAIQFLEAMKFFPDNRNGKRENNGRVWTRENCVEVSKIARTLNPERAQKNKLTLAQTLKMINIIYDADEILYNADAVLI